MATKRFSDGSSIKNTFKLSRGATSVAKPTEPTIGTATAGAQSSATIAFTASPLGPTPSSFSVISNPVGGSGTGTSPISVTGLTSLTSYTFAVRASNANGDSPYSSYSNSITTTEAYAVVSRSLGSFTTAGTSNPYGDWGYFQGMGAAFPSANVFILTGSYTSNYVISGTTYSLANGGGGYTNRASYPTTIFQTAMLAFQSKMFVFGGNGLNATPGGGTTAAVYYLNTALNSWTAGTTLPFASSWGATSTPNRIIVSQGTGKTYRGIGTGPWTLTTDIPYSGVGYIGNRAYGISSSATFYSDDDGVTWTNRSITPPLSTGPMVVPYTDGNTATSIYLFYNTDYTTTPAGYYFNGTSYTSTTNFGTQRTDGSGSAVFAAGINGNQLTVVFGASGYRYATINA